MKNFYLLNGFWIGETGQIPEFGGLYATRELAEEAFHKLTAILDEQGYVHSLFITEVPLRETSDEVDALVNHFHYNMKERQKREFIKSFCNV